MFNHARNRGNIIARVPIGIDLNTDEGRCKAFHQLARECLGGAKTIAAGYPQSIGEYILTAHALELGLKAFLAKFGVPNETLRNTFGHNLLMLHEEACKRGLSISAANAKSDIEWIGEYHSAPLRYDFRKCELPASERLFQIVEAVACGRASCFRARHPGRASPQQTRLSARRPLLPFRDRRTK
jgi:hypothetical protein